MKDLKFRRQYFLLKGDTNSFSNWNKTPISENFNLYSHSELELTEVSNGSIRLILLGFIIDPYNPGDSNEDILKKILGEGNTEFDEVVESTYSLGGRWILIFNSESVLKMFSDPCGLRQIYYSTVKGLFCCGSQPNLIAEVLGLKQDTNDYELNCFLESQPFKEKEFAWFGDGTPFREIKHLLPNHFFDIENQQIFSFWIDKEIEKKLDRTVEDACQLLQGSIQAINNRGKLLLALTAGWDSRILLAASKTIKDDIKFWMSTKGVMSKNHYDVKAPKKLASNLGLDFEVLDKFEPVRPEVLNHFKRNTFYRGLRKNLTIQYHLDNHEGMLNINGNVSGIAKNVYGTPESELITGEYIAKKFEYHKLKYPVNKIDEWLVIAKKRAQKWGIHVLDLFYWEQRMGNWGAVYPAEQDIAIEEFSPFNNRKLLMLLLKTDVRERTGPDYRLYRLIIHKMWKETLDVPINGGRIQRIWELIKNVIPRSWKKGFKTMLGRKALSFLP